MQRFTTGELNAYNHTHTLQVPLPMLYKQLSRAQVTRTSGVHSTPERSQPLGASTPQSNHLRPKHPHQILSLPWAGLSYFRHFIRVFPAILSRPGVCLATPLLALLVSFLGGLVSRFAHRGSLMDPKRHYADSFTSGSCLLR